MWLFKFEKWCHVAEFKIYSGGGSIYMHLYESESGKRKVKFGSTHVNLSNSRAKIIAMKSELYHERIVRWLGGRHDIEIPRYSELAMDDTANALKNIVK